MTAISPQTINFVKHWEGFSATPYRDGRGWTIGYGHWSLYRPQRCVTRKQAEALLLADLQRVQRSVLDSLPPRAVLNENQITALDDFVFNVGITAWRDSVLRHCLVSELYRGGAKQFKRWIHGPHGVVIPALVRRRAAEEKLFTGKERK